MIYRLFFLVLSAIVYIPLITTTVSGNEIVAELLTEDAIVAEIINGSQVTPDDDQWRFIVSLQRDGIHYCGGSLITPTWVLTAAHCLVDDYGTPSVPDDTYKVMSGSYSLLDGQLNNIKSFIVHPSYDPYMLDNDIALIELAEPIDGIDSVVLDSSSLLLADTQSEVAGWGNISTSGTEYPIDLMEALVPIVDFDLCNSSYGILTNNMICAGYMQSDKDSCQGDSGGPLIAWDSNKWQQVGIVSWGYQCAQDYYPGVYTKVQNYVEWIESYTGNLNIAPTLIVNPTITMYLLN